MVKAKTKKGGKGKPFKKGKKKTGGRKTGVKNKKTIAIEKIYEEHQQAILAELTELRSAHFSVAKGVSIVLARDWIKNKKGVLERQGRFIRITDPSEIEEMVAGENEEGETYHIISIQDPNPKALEDLINRVFGKPKEHFEFDFKAKELKDIQDGVRALIEMAKKRNK